MGPGRGLWSQRAGLESKGFWVRGLGRARLGLGFLAATRGPELGEIGAGSRDCFSLRRGLRRMEGRLEGLGDLGAGPKDCVGPP